MISTRITPRVVSTCLALHLGLWLVLDLLVQSSAGGRFGMVKAAERMIALMLAYAVAFSLNLEIAAEYKHAGWLRVAWLALAANAGISFFRPVFESRILDLISPGSWERPLFGLVLHLLIIPANCFLLFGVLAMWFAYHRVGLGFKIERRDYVAMAGVLVLMLGLLAYRENLTEAQSPYVTSRVLQPIGLVLLSVCSAVSLVLYRLAVQMGGGQLARALRWLTIYALLRGVLVLVRALKLAFLPEAGSLVDRYILEIGWQVVPWIVTLAAACRVELTVRAARELEQRRAAKRELVSV